MPICSGTSRPTRGTTATPFQPTPARLIRAQFSKTWQYSTNATFARNSAIGGSAQGGGIRNDGQATFRNTIIANSPSGGDCVSTVALSGTNSHNLIKDNMNACGLVNGANSNKIGLDPVLGTLTSPSGGGPPYFPLLSGSLAIDAGNNATCAAAPVNNQSQNGVPRPQDGDGDRVAVCDIGAYE